MPSRAQNASTPQEGWDAAHHYVSQALMVARLNSSEKEEGWKRKVIAAHAELTGHLYIVAWSMEKHHHYRDQGKIRDLARLVSRSDMSKPEDCDAIEKCLEDLQATAS